MSDVSRRPTVLLITPFADERQMYELSLRAAGFDVSVCDDTHYATKLAATERVGAVVMRIRQRGDLDGIELTRRIKDDVHTRHIPVVIISTFIQADVETAALAAGCDRFLLLPILPDELVAALHAVMQRTSESGS